MKYYLAIRRLHKIGDNYYYHLTTSDFGGWNLILEINPTTKQLVFFDKKKQEIPLGKLNLEDADQKLKIGNINIHVIWGAFRQATRAVSLNDFPDAMDYGA